MAASTNRSLMFLDLVELLPGAMEEGSKRAAHMLWYDLVMPIVREHWLVIIGILFLIFFAVILKAMMGRWGSLGSFLYNCLYFGTLLLIGMIWGPEVFLGDFFKAACTAILYPICYWLSGYVMDRMGVGPHHPRR